MKGNIMNTSVRKVVSAVLDDASSSAITAVVSATEGIKGKTSKMVDLLQGRGVTSSMLDKPKDKKADNPNKELHFGINVAIVNGLPVEWQSLISKATNTLSQADKDTKRYAQQQVGSYYGKIKRALIERENPNSKGARHTRPAIERIKSALNDALEIAQKLEDANFNVAKFGQDVKALIAMVK